MIILVFHISENGSEIIFGHLCQMILDKKLFGTNVLYTRYRVSKILPGRYKGYVGMQKC